MSFGECVFLVGFIQKNIKEDLFIKINHEVPPRNRYGKTLEDSRRRITEAYPKGLPYGAKQPLGPPVSLRVAMSVLHRLLGCIYAIL